MEALYGAIDLHSDNSVLAIIDATGKRVFDRRLPNEVDRIAAALAPFRDRLKGIVVESTFNWYWLVDGLMERGYRMHLANPAAIQQYSGLKHGDDQSDAYWLAELLRLGILPEGYIYPKAERAVRDLARKRGQLVRQRTANLLSIKNTIRRSTGGTVKSDVIKAMEPKGVSELAVDADVGLAIEANVCVRACLDEQIAKLERAVLQRAKLKPEFEKLKSIPGVGNIVAMTIMLETGGITRFASVGDFASYCRCVDSKRLSNKKKKGQGNTKNGNRYLAWAFVEAANFAIRYSQPIQRFHQRKQARTKNVVAIKAVAHKLARASYYIMRDQVIFDVDKSFT